MASDMLGKGGKGLQDDPAGLFGIEANAVLLLHGNGDFQRIQRVDPQRGIRTDQGIIQLDSIHIFILEITGSADQDQQFPLQ
jgi:hypothetical protein